MLNATRFLLLLAVFFTPLIGETFNFGYEQAKVIFFIFLISITFIFWLLGKPKLKWDLVKTFSLIFIIALLITSLTGLNFNNSLWGTEPYFQGWITYFYLFIFSLMVSSLKIPLKYYAFALTASALVVSSVALEDWILKNLLGYNVVNYAGRVVSTFGQPNFYAGFLLLTLPLSYYLKGFGGFGGFFSVLGILASESRSAILLMMILLILMLVNQFKFKFLIGVFVYSLIIFSAVAGLYFSSGIIGNEVSKPAAAINPDLTRESVEKRAYIWPATLQVINEKPIMGQGLENINPSFSNYFKNNFYDLFEANQKVSPVLLSL
ncbi:MAG: O-antigen ligase family protein, partial [Candidatus Daviesbacteria bacterium]|nr:O-antigen ligase family protein [Candidatus Daviesbacteria bacterium]